jgi:hypothetical protein
MLDITIIYGIPQQYFLDYLFFFSKSSNFVEAEKCLDSSAAFSK